MWSPSFSGFPRLDSESEREEEKVEKKKKNRETTRVLLNNAPADGVNSSIIKK